MTVYSDKLREMIFDAPEQSENIADNISQITDTRDEIQEQIDAVNTGMCSVAETDAKDYIENTILPAVGGDYVSYGTYFGSIDYSNGNLTDFEIYQTQVTPPGSSSVSDTLLYTYSRGDYPTLDALVDDWDFGNDYLTRPLTSGATYGLIPYRDSLDDAIDILTENKDKVDGSVTYFETYAT
jgi:hypothetical protein